MIMFIAKVFTQRFTDDDTVPFTDDDTVPLAQLPTFVKHVFCDSFTVTLYV